MATNTEFALRTGGDLYYDINETDSSALTPYDETNSEVIRAELEALTWNTIGNIAGFAVSHTIENESEVNAMNCGVGTFLKTADKQANISSTMLEVNRLDVISSILWSSRESVTGAPTAVTAEAHGTGWTVGTPIKLDYKNGDNTIVDLTGVGAVKAGAGNLVRGTDFNDYVDGDGWTYIVPVTTQTLAITADYSYTPNSAENNTYVFENDEIPFGNYKFVSCAYNSGDGTGTPRRRDYIYMVKFSMGGELAERYLNTGENLEGAEVTLNGDLGGLYIKHIVKWATKASV